MQVQEIMKQMSQDPGLVDQIKENPQKALKEMVASSPLASDVVVYRVVVIGLASALLSAMVGALILSFFGKPTPEVVTALGSAAVGALAGLLAPPPLRS